MAIGSFINPASAGSCGDLLHVQDQKAQGTDGGTFTTGAWRTRDLNTVLKNEISGASLAGNRVTLPAGIYLFKASNSFGVDTITIYGSQIYDITNSKALSYHSFYLHAFSSQNQTIDYQGIISLSGSTQLELRNKTMYTIANYGFGKAGGEGIEIYSDIIFEKVR